MTCENSHVSVREPRWRRLSIADLGAPSQERGPQPVGPDGNAAHASWNPDSGSGVAAEAKRLRSRSAKCKTKKETVDVMVAVPVEFLRGQDEKTLLLKSIITCFQENRGKKAQKGGAGLLGSEEIKFVKVQSPGVPATLWQEHTRNYLLLHMVKEQMKTGGINFLFI